MIAMAWMAIARMCSCLRTHIAGRTVEEKTPREIRRGLKRHIARELCRPLNRSMNPPACP